MPEITNELDNNVLKFLKETVKFFEGEDDHVEANVRDFDIIAEANNLSDLEGKIDWVRFTRLI